MAYYKIYYSCGCGDNEDYIEADSIEEAEQAAYQEAIDDYDRYAGLHGVLSISQLAEEMWGDPMSGADYDLNTLTEEQMETLYDAYNEEIENTIDYWAEEISEREYENQGEVWDDEDEE